MDGSESETDMLVTQAGAGDAQAREQLLALHRDRLRRMVDVRMDRRMAARLDASDVVQEALAEAARQLDRYLRHRELPFYAWLRQVAWQRLLQLQRHHVQSQKRSVLREQVGNRQPLPDESAFQLVEQLVGSQTSPSQGVIRNETMERVRAAMGQLKAEDRELLVLRHLEQLTVEETAATLEMSAGNVKVRHFRAVQQLRKVLGDQ